MVTVVPIWPVAGVKLVIEGEPAAVTVKSVALVAVLVPTVTVTFPLIAPAGTVVVMLVAVLAVTVATVPLNFTILDVGVVLKFEPLIITVVPADPERGLKEVMVGEPVVTVKSTGLVAVLAPTVTVILPVIAPAGTVVVMLVAVLVVTVAVVAPNFTELLVAVVLKFVPVMVTAVPTGPEVGETLVTERTGICVPDL
jgi:hypothetical protein